MNFFRRFMPMHLVLDAHPSLLTFTCAAKGFYLAIPTFAYVGNDGERSTLLSLGEEYPGTQHEQQGIYRVDVFEPDEPLPPGTTFSRDDLIVMMIEYAIGKTSADIVPIVRPFIFIMGADRFKDRYPNPREAFGRWARRAGAMRVIFDRREL